MMTGLEKIIFSKSKMFYAFCFCFILGVGAFSFIEEARWVFYLYISIFVFLFSAIIFWDKRIARFIFLSVLFFIIGGWRFASTIPTGGSNEINHFNGSRIFLIGQISSEPDLRISEARYVLNVKSCKTRSLECPKNISGKVILKLPLHPQYNFGDTLEVSCSLQSPKNYQEGNFNYIVSHIISFARKSSGKPAASLAHFDYEKYLAKDRIWSICSNPKVLSVFAPTKFSVKIVKLIYDLKLFFQNQIDRLWPEPQSSFVAGLLYGSKRGMPPDLLDNFNRTGITHIIAVSGFNISIIATYLMFFLIYIGFFRQRAFWVAVAGIIFFVIFTGASASVVRAGVMGVVVLLARHIGRASHAGNILIFTAAAMALINPYVLIWDVGFQLSFLATMGLIYLSPQFERKWKFLDHKYLKFLKETFVATMSAIIATLPLILFQFGRLSIVAPFVNILILWLIPFLMLFGFAALVLSFIIFPLGQALAWLTGLGLNYVIITVDWFGGKSWSAVEFSVPFWLMAIMYLAIFLYAKNYAAKSKGSSFGGGV